jgi:hypothetical protein
VRAVATGLTAPKVKAQGVPDDDSEGAADRVAGQLFAAPARPVPTHERGKHRPRRGLRALPCCTTPNCPGPSKRANAKTHPTTTTTTNATHHNHTQPRAQARARASSPAPQRNAPSQLPAPARREQSNTRPGTSPRPSCRHAINTRAESGRPPVWHTQCTENRRCEDVGPQWPLRHWCTTRGRRAATGSTQAHDPAGPTRGLPLYNSTGRGGDGAAGARRAEWPRRSLHASGRKATARRPHRAASGAGSPRCGSTSAAHTPLMNMPPQASSPRR